MTSLCLADICVKITLILLSILWWVFGCYSLHLLQNTESGYKHGSEEYCSPILLW